MIGVPSQVLGRPIFQYAYVVEDIDLAVARWVALFGAGPFFVEPHHLMPSGCFRYRGGDEQAMLSHAFGYCGAAQIQLMRQDDERPSIIREMYAPGSQGFHHVGALTESFEEDFTFFRKMGLESAVELAFPALDDPNAEYRVAYFDARAQIGCFVELYAATPGPLAAFEQWRNAHEQWDGRTDPIRRSDLAGPRETR